jgi:hypothetical protein
VEKTSSDSSGFSDIFQYVGKTITRGNPGQLYMETKHSDEKRERGGDR